MWMRWPFLAIGVWILGLNGLAIMTGAFPVYPAEGLICFGVFAIITAFESVVVAREPKEGHSSRGYSPQSSGESCQHSR